MFAEIWAVREVRDGLHAYHGCRENGTGDWFRAGEQTLYFESMGVGLAAGSPMRFRVCPA